MNIFASPLGGMLNFIYNLVSGVNLDYEYLSAYAISIIVATIIFKFLLLPLSLKQTKSMKEMQNIQPQIKEIQKKYKSDPQTQQAKTMELYKEHKVNPFGSCLPLLVQFPIIIGFFTALRNPAQYMASYGDITNRTFLWIKDIGFAANEELASGVINGLSFEGLNIPFIGAAIPVLAILAGLTTYMQSKMMSSSTSIDEKAQSTQKTMTTIMPIMIFVFALNFPAGLTLYWVIGNVFTIGQQYYTNKAVGKIKEELK